jgi:hypothetical protein
MLAQGFRTYNSIKKTFMANKLTVNWHYVVTHVNTNLNAGTETSSLNTWYVKC